MLMFSFTTFKFVPPISPAAPSINPVDIAENLGIRPPKFRLKVVVEKAVGYVSGESFRRAAGVLVILSKARTFTSRSGEATFLVYPGDYILIVNDPHGLMRAWVATLRIRSNITVIVRFNVEYVGFSSISVESNVLESMSTVKVSFKVPDADIAYLGNPVISYINFEGRKIFAFRQYRMYDEEVIKRFVMRTPIAEEVAPGTEYERDLTVNDPVLFVFPEDSYFIVGMVFSEIKEE